jgi:hypothetical protein
MSKRSIIGRKFPLMFLAALVALLGISSVGAQSDENAWVRIVHASPDAPAVDIWVDGEVAIPGLAFGEATDYVELPAGDYDVAVTPAGAGAEDAVIEATLTLEGGMAYTVAAVGEVADIEPLVLVDDLTAPADGMAHVRVVHASPDAPDVDVAVADGPVLIEGLAFKADSGYLPVDAMSYDLEVRPAGTEDVAIDIAGFNAEAGTVYTVMAIGLAGDGSLTVLPLVDAQYSQATGGGDTEEATPSLPATGAGGMADGSMSNAAILAIVLGGAAVIGGGAFLLTNRRTGNVTR